MTNLSRLLLRQRLERRQPVVLAGHCSGSIKPGRHVIYPAETPMANLYVSMLDRMNVKRESFGDSKAELDQLDLT